MTVHTEQIAVTFTLQQVAQLQAIARAQGDSLDAVIRRAVEEVYFQEPRQLRLDAVRQMASLNLPVAHWQQMERESTRWPSRE